MRMTRNNSHAAMRGRSANEVRRVQCQPNSASFPATTGAPAETISYTYGGNGRTATVTDNRGTTTMNYRSPQGGDPGDCRDENGNDRVSSVADPVTGTTTYSYGLAGQRTSMGLPGGGTWNYAYVTGGGSGGTGEVRFEAGFRG